MGSVHRRFNNANIIALKSLGYRIELCANFEVGDGPESCNRDYVEYCKKNGITTHSIPFARHRLFGNLKCLRELHALLKREQYAIVHTHTETGGFLLRLSMNVKGNTRFIYTPHGMSFWNGSGMISQLIYKPIEKWICSAMDKNLGMNKEEVDNLKKWNSESAVYVHGIGLNIDKFQCTSCKKNDVRKEFGLNDDDKFILSVGELDDNKNHITVIRALSMLDTCNYKYIICGVGSNEEILSREISIRGLSSKVILTGYRNDIPNITNAADIFVFPSFHEGLPVSLLEAMASGKPVICSEIRGNVDVVKDGVNGFLFNPSDVNTLKRKLQLLCNDPSLCDSMGKKNRGIVENFSLSAVVEELKVIYSSNDINDNE